MGFIIKRGDLMRKLLVSLIVLGLLINWMPTSAEADSPTVTISDVPSGTQTSNFTVTITFSEAVDGFTTRGIKLDPHTLASPAWLSGSDGDTTFTLRVNPQAGQSGTLTIGVPADVVTATTGGEGNKAATSVTVTVDNQRPTVAISGVPTTEQNSAFDLTITFSEDVTGFATGDLTVTGEAAATAVAAVGTSKSKYTATITPNANKEGDVTVKVKADTVTDTVGNSNTASAATGNIRIDTIRPTPTITAPTTPQNGLFNVTIDFGETVTGFVKGDITIGGTATRTVGSLTGSGASYTLPITPSTSGTITIDVAANVAKDSANNNNRAATRASVATDTDAPVATITAPTTEQNGAFDVTVDFGENVTGFAANDLSTPGFRGTRALKSGTSGSQRYTLTLTPASTETDIVVTLYVAADRVMDAAGNNNLISAEFALVRLDTHRPRVTSITGVPTTDQKGAFDLTITFLEDVTGFATGDLTVTGEATATAVAAVGTSKSKYTATITPNANKEGDVTVKVNADTVTDTAGNSNTASAATGNIRIDTIRPTVAIRGVPTTEKKGAFDLGITFSEDVTGFATDDLTVTGEATVTAVARVGTRHTNNYIATITPNATSEGDVTVTVNANAATDAAGNGNTASAATGNIHIDTIRPTPTITAPTTPQNGAFDVTVDFGENVYGFVANDLIASVTTHRPVLKSGTEGSQRYTLTITPSSGVYSIVLSVKKNLVTDAAGNNNSPSKFVSVRIDTIVPTTTITGGPLEELRGAFDLIVTFSEDVTGFATDDLTVTGEATATAVAAVGEGKSKYAATITPNANKEGDVTVTVKADAVTDTAGNGNTASSATGNIHVDTIRPTPTITATSPQNYDFDVTIDFGENVYGFAESDITIGGTATHIVGPLLGNLSGGRISSYTFRITPTTATSGTITIDVAANVAMDDAGNSNNAATQKTVIIDKDPPTATITAPTTPQNGPFDVTVDFGENVYGFVASDLTATGTTERPVLKSGTEGSQRYTLTITPSDGTYIRLYVDQNVVADAAGNYNPLSGVVSVDIDKVPPTATITGVPSTDQNGAFDLTITFHEDVTGFATDDLTVTGEATATAAAAVGESKSEYTATITPNAGKEGDVTVTVNADAVTDTAGNTNTASSATGNIRVDTIRPTATISDVPTTVQNGPFDLTITYSEDVTGLGDITMTGEVLNAEVSGSGRSRTVTITPMANAEGTITVQVAEGGVEDAAGNSNTVSAVTPNIHTDTIVPTVEISGVPTTVQNGAFDLTVTFSEDVTGFATEALTVTGEATATAVAPVGESKSEYTATITPNAGKEGDVTVQVNANAVTDAAGNTNTAASATTGNIHVDTIRPTPTISAPTTPQNGFFDVAIDFGEDVADFDLLDHITIGGTATLGVPMQLASDSSEGGGAAYTLTLIATTSGTITIDIPADAVTDLHGNGNNAATQATVTIDVDAPAPTITVPTTPQNGPFDVTVDFGEDVTGFVVGDLTVANATKARDWKSGEAGSQTYTITLTPTITATSSLSSQRASHGNTGTVAIDVAANVARDTAGNSNNAATQKTVTVDKVPPTATITAPTTPQNGAFDVTVDFGENVTGFAANDLSTPGFPGTRVLKSGTSGSQRYTLTLTPPSTENDLNVTLYVAADRVMDAAGNNNLISAEFAIVRLDTHRPRVTSITGVPTTDQKGAFDLTITFHEDVTGFAKGDLTVTGEATATAVAAVGESKKEYTATITPNANKEGDVTVKVNADTVTDAAGNNNTASSATDSIRVDTIRPTATISDVPTTPQNGAFDVTVDFSEAVTGFTASDLTTSGLPFGSRVLKSGTDGSQRYTVTITPPTGSIFIFTGTVFLSVGHNLVTDAAGNDNPMSEAVSVDIDTAPPTATITGVPSTDQNGAFDLTITFSEDVTGFATGDLTVTGEATATAVAAVGTSKKEYTATITPNVGKEGDVTVQVNANAVTDAAGNNNTASSATGNIRIDTIAPTATISGVPTTEQNGAFTFTITFNEDVTGFAATDLTVTGPATATLAGSGSSYTATITPNANAEGFVTVQIPAAAVEDLAGNVNTAFDLTDPIRVNTKALTVELEGVPDTVQLEDFSVAIVFSSDVEGFVVGAIEITGDAVVLSCDLTRLG